MRGEDQPRELGTGKNIINGIHPLWAGDSCDTKGEKKRSGVLGVL